MKKTIFCIGLIAILLLTGFSTVSAIENKASDVKEAGTVHGPLMAPAIIGNIKLSEDAVYSSKHNIGKLYIYRDVKLTGIAWGPGPHEPDDPMATPFSFQQFLFLSRSWSGIGNITLTMKLWIGAEIPETVGGIAEFYFRFTGQAFSATLEEL